MFRVLTCLATEHDHWLVAARGRRLLRGKPRRRLPVRPRALHRKTCPRRVDRGGRRGGRLRHLGDPLHRDARLRAGRPGRLRRRAHHALACRGRCNDQRRPRGGLRDDIASESGRRRRHRRRRRRRDALHRNGGAARARPRHLVRRPRHGFDRVRHPACRRGADGGGAPARRAHDAVGRRSAHARDRAAPFHRDGRGDDPARPGAQPSTRSPFPNPFSR